MDIDRVRYFNVFSEMGSLVRAAEVLHISQPALSKALRLLQSEVGLKLLEPEGRGLRLTEAGREFKRETAPLLSQWLEISAKVRGTTASVPTRIGSFEVFTTYFLGHLMKYISMENMELHELGPGRLEQAIAESQIDIGITYIPIPKSGIEFVEVTKIRMGTFGRVDKFKGTSSESLPFVIPLFPSEGTPSKVMGLDGWPDHKFARLVKFRVTMMESALELCRGGHAVAYLPEFVVDLHNESVRHEQRLKEFESPISRKESLQSVFLVRKQYNKETPLERQIAKCLRSLK